MKLSAIIIARNEAVKIGDCLESIKDLAEEIILVDGGSTDETSDIAKKYGAKVIKTIKKDFSGWRNDGLMVASGDWVFYIDADERVTPLLKKEIETIVNGNAGNFTVYAIPRRNIILGREMKHGGWWPDYVKRLFRKKDLIKWQGELHEEPVYSGVIGHLKNPLVHLKHDNLTDMVTKTNSWSEVEARGLLEANHPPVVWWRFIRIMLTEGFYRLFWLGGILDGPEGIIYGLYQSWSRFVTYAKLWEMQLKNK